MEFQKAAVEVCVTHEWLRSHPAGCLFSLGSFDVRAVYSLEGNQMGRDVESSVDAALYHTPSPDIVEHYRVLRERHQWAVLQFVPTFTCYHQLCRPHAREAVYTVLCVNHRIYELDDDDFPFLPLDVWYIVLSHAKTTELGAPDA